MTASSRAYRRVPLPRTWDLRASDVVVLAAGNAVLILAMWVRHGGLAQLDTLAGVLTAAGQLAALYATYLVLVQLVLMSRSPWLDQLFGMDRLTAAHRWVGFGAVWLIVAHGVLTTVGYGLGDGTGPLAEAVTLLTRYPYVLWATAGGVLFVAVAISSVRAARRRVSYETWYGIHLYVYLAIALSFLHQLVVGTDFATDPVARIYWIGLYVAAVSTVLAFRFGQPLALFARHRLRVQQVVREGPDVVSIYVAGRDLDRLAVRSGQYFVLRFLTADGWWRGHPFSISAAPNGQWLRFTVKELGDWTARLRTIRPGTAVWAEGPYGVLTGARRRQRRVLLVAGGIGITPLRALLEGLPGRRDELTLLYRASRPEDLVFQAELHHLARVRGATVHYLVGRRGIELAGDPLAANAIRRLVPDVHQRDVFLCGPAPMIETVCASLRALRVPEAQVHFERFAYLSEP